MAVPGAGTGSSRTFGFFFAGSPPQPEGAPAGRPLPSRVVAAPLLAGRCGAALRPFPLPLFDEEPGLGECASIRAKSANDRVEYATIFAFTCA